MRKAGPAAAAQLELFRRLSLEPRLKAVRSGQHVCGMRDAVLAELPAAPHVARHVSHIMPLLLPGRDGFWFLAHGRLFLRATVLVH